jgi:peptide chain release factor subunit 1
MAAHTISRGRLRQLIDASPDRGRVLSVFLNLDPAEFPTPPARATAITSVLNEAARKIEACEGLDHEEHQWLRADLDRVRETLTNADIASNGTRAVAVYACEPLDLLEIVPLRRPTASHAVVDRAPAIGPLVWESDDERWVVVLANRRNARIFRGTGDGIEETDRIQDDVHSQHDQGGWSQARYQRSVEKEKDDHLAHVADVLFDIFKTSGVDCLLVGGPDELVGELEDRLHDYLRKRCVGRLHIDVDNSLVDDVRAAVVEAREERATQQEREALDRLIEGVGRGTRGAGGLPDVLMALNEARVECLLLAEGFRASGLRDTQTGTLYAENAAPAGAATERVEDIVEAAVELAVEQAARVLRISRHDDLGPLGGIGAILRY